MFAATFGLVVPTTVLVAGLVWGETTRPVLGGPTLLAQGTSPTAVIDTDGDAIPDDQELQLSLAVFNPDNDQDGFADPIEIAHGTSPFDQLDTPAATAYSQAGIGITARTDGDDLRLCVVMHAPEGSMAGKTVRFGILLGGLLHGIPASRLAVASDTFTADFGAEGSVEVWDMRFPANLVLAHQDVTFVAALGSEGVTSYTTADVLDLSARDGAVLMRRKKVLTPGQGHAAFLAGGDSDTVHQPLPTFSNPVPTDWFAGRVCYQRAITVGVAGSRIIREVVEAECRGDWDSYCEPNCVGTVGLLVESIDPGSLVGG